MEAAAAIEEREPSNTIEGSIVNLSEHAAASNAETAGMDFPRLVLKNGRELETLQKLKMSLKRFLTLMSIGDVEEIVSWSNIFRDVPESVITARVRQLYKKHERRIVEVYGNAIDGLMVLINNQILLVSRQITMIKEIMSRGALRERTVLAEHRSEEYSPTYAPRREEDGHGTMSFKVMRLAFKRKQFLL